MKRLLFLVPIALVVLALGPASASAGYWRHCGSQNHVGAGWYHVKAHNVHCHKARAAARRFTHGSFFDGTEPSPLGFSCQARQIGIELAHAACRRQQGDRVQQVRWIFGA
jgi:hypothetical protein